MNQNFPVRTAIIAGVCALIAIPALLGSWYTIDQTERGVLLRNGAVIGMAQPGLGFKVPIIDSVVKASVQTHIEQFDKLLSYSFDQQVATMRVSVNYRLKAEEVDTVYKNFGSLAGLVGRIIQPQVAQQTKIVFGRYTAAKAIQDRGKLNADVESAVRDSIAGAAPVIIESVQIEDVDFSDVYEKSIEQRMLAEVEVQKIRQNAEREKVQAEIAVIQAKAQADAQRAKAAAQADAVRLEAQAQADSTRLRGDADAYSVKARNEADAIGIKIRGEASAIAIKARTDALKDSPGLIALTQAERWNGQLPTTMLPNGGVPLLSLGK